LARRNAAIVEVLEDVAIRIDVDVPAVAADTFAGHQAAYQELAGAAIAALGTIAARLAEHGDPQLEELRLRVLRALV
jgi:hypothetical protein